MNVIPAIDIVNGKCVRLTQGDFNQKTIYSDDPVKIAKQFEHAGFTNLHVVDLDGAKNGMVTNWTIVERLVSETKLEIDFGGGIKTASEVERLLRLGVKQVNIGSLAVRNPKLVADWIEFFGAKTIILSADFKDDLVATNGWVDSTAVSVTQLIQQFNSYGIENVTCTDISRDGMLNGPNVQFYKSMQRMFPAIRFTASGGIRSLEDLEELQQLGLHGAIVGKALYEGRVEMKELASKFL